VNLKFFASEFSNIERTATCVCVTLFCVLIYLYELCNDSYAYFFPHHAAVNELIVSSQPFSTLQASRCLCREAPAYLAEMCTPVSSTSVNQSRLSSAVHGDLVVICSRTTICGWRCFAVSGPTLWNSLSMILLWPITDTDLASCALEYCVTLHRLWGTTIAALQWHLRQ